MAMSTFYHYTDDDGAKLIIRTGTIQASLKDIRTGDAAFGNAVYLTKLSPQTSTKDEIAMNNWTRNNAATRKKLKNYFIINIPEDETRNSNAVNRNIYLFGFGKDLRLYKYSWVLKDYESGRIIASYKYRVSSTGPATEEFGDVMGDYRMVEDIWNGRPFYKREIDYYSDFLVMNSQGNWMVTEQGSGVLVQRSGNYSLGPEHNHPWWYGYDDNPGKTRIDDQIKVKPYGNPSFDFDEVEELV